MIGIASDRLFPATPWHAEHVSDLAKPGLSSGPAAATPPSALAARAMAMTISRIFVGPMRPPFRRARSGEDVAPDALRPAERPLGDGLALRRGKLLLDLDDLVVLDLVGVHDRDRLAVADPAVAGVARRHRRRRAVIQQLDHGRRTDLSH